MSGFEEHIVREYFEQHGFLVRQLRRSQESGKRRMQDETIDLVVFNPTFAPTDREPSFLIFTTELAYLERAVVIPRAWHQAARFSPNLLKSSSEVQKFIEKHAAKEMEAFGQTAELPVGWETAKRILVLPSLPTREPHRTESIDFLRNIGIDGVVSFRAIALDVIAKLEAGRIYDKNPSMELLRGLKVYDLLKEPQLGLF